jgi:hypothetical protein
MNQLRKTNRIARLLAALTLATVLMINTASAPAASPVNTYTVTSTADSGEDTLRYAINQANTNPGADTITFNLSGCASVCTISPLTALPALSAGGTTIDGYTQPGSAPATRNEPATILVELDGSLSPASYGLGITSAGNTIQGLAIVRFKGNGVAISGAAATGNVIAGNHIGVTPSADLTMGNLWDGVYIGEGATDNLVGGEAFAERNIIGGNGWDGVGIYGSGSDRNVVSGNYIGTNGADPLGNNLSGVHIYGGTKDNRVGGNTLEELNLISGNGLRGVNIVGAGTDGNLVDNNHIGVTLDFAALGNAGDGVYIGSGAQSNVVGSGPGNLITGNLENGVQITGTNTLSNTVARNSIGAEQVTHPDVGNGKSGVFIGGGAGNTLVGGDADADQGNLISGNGVDGVLISGDTAYNIVSGNRIGVDSGGTVALGNAYHGVILGLGAHHNRIGGVNTMPGGACSGECNLISGNHLSGIVIAGETTQNNTVLGNYIGTDASGTSALANEGRGISITSAKYNTIGGEAPEVGNLISGNDMDGVAIFRISSYDAYNVISGNIIGLNASGTSDVSNGGSGVSIDGSNHNRIGGETSAGGNTISGNGECGVKITHGSLSNELRFNRIGTSQSEMVALANASHGVLVELGSQENLIGGADDSGGNIISGNLGDGVRLQDTDTQNNQVLGNLIGSQSHTFSDLGNTGNGVTIRSGASENTVAGHNYLVYNSYGVVLDEDGTLNNVITANWIADSDFSGVYIGGGAKANTIGPENMIRSNLADGVVIESAVTYANVVTRNAIGENAAAGINLESGANHDIQPPVIAAIAGNALSVQISGTSCAGCIVEVYGNRAADGEGEIYIDSEVADADGNWRLEVERLFYPYLTATATAVLDGTSEFSVAFANPYRYVFMPLVIR